MDKVSQALMPAAVTGVVAGAGAKLMFGPRYMALPGGYTVPAYVGYGVLGAGSKLLNVLVADTVIPYIAGDGSIIGLSVEMASPLITGAALVGLDMLAEGPKLDQHALKVFALGAGADVAGQWISDRVLG